MNSENIAAARGEVGGEPESFEESHRIASQVFAPLTLKHQKEGTSPKYGDPNIDLRRSNP